MKLNLTSYQLPVTSYQLPVTSYQLLTNASILLFFGLFFCCAGFLGLGVFWLLALSLVFIPFHKLLNRFQSHFLHEVRHPRTLTRHVLQEVRHPRALARHVLQEVRHLRAVARHVLQEVRHPRTVARHVLQEVRHPRALVRHTIEWLKPMFLVLFDIKLVTESQNSHLREANTV